MTHIFTSVDCAAVHVLCVFRWLEFVSFRIEVWSFKANRWPVPVFKSVQEYLQEQSVAVHECASVQRHALGFGGSRIRRFSTDTQQ